MNYDASQVGVPYVRYGEVKISNPPGAMPSVVAEKFLAVKLADGSVRTLETLAPLNITLDLLNDATSPVPMINPENDTALGADATIQGAQLSIYAILRKFDIEA